VYGVAEGLTLRYKDVSQSGMDPVEDNLTNIVMPAPLSYETALPSTPASPAGSHTKHALDYETLRATVAGQVFTRTQAVELVGFILDNVRDH